MRIEHSELQQDRGHQSIFHGKVSGTVCKSQTDSSAQLLTNLRQAALVAWCCVLAEAKRDWRPTRAVPSPRTWHLTGCLQEQNGPTGTLRSQVCERKGGTLFLGKGLSKGCSHGPLTWEQIGVSHLSVANLICDLPGVKRNFREPCPINRLAHNFGRVSNSYLIVRRNYMGACFL